MKALRHFLCVVCLFGFSCGPSPNSNVKPTPTPQPTPSLPGAAFSVGREIRAYVIFFRMQSKSDSEQQCFATAGPSNIMARPGDTIVWEVIQNEGCSSGGVRFEFIGPSPFVNKPTFSSTKSVNVDNFTAQIRSDAASGGTLFPYHVGGYFSDQTGSSKFHYLEDLQISSGPIAPYTPYALTPQLPTIRIINF